MAIKPTKVGASRKEVAAAKKRRAKRAAAGEKRGDVESKRAKSDARESRSCGKPASRRSSPDSAKKRPGRVRDKFTMPARDYGLIDALKKRCRTLGIDVKKSELLRAGLAAVHSLPDDRLVEVMKPLVAARS